MAIAVNRLFMHPLILTANKDELGFIANLDYGQDKDRHLACLNNLIFKRNCLFEDDDYWFPYEVIQLGTNSIKPGHEREFVLCCLLVLEAIKSGFDSAYDKESKYNQIEPLLMHLPKNLALMLIKAYADDS